MDAVLNELSLPDMLLSRDDHPLAVYVRGEIRHRFDHLACETVTEFQMASRRAMTIHRHVKQNHRQHAKDDRRTENDRRDFVLGWDNRAKRESLEQSIRKQQAEADRCKSEIESLRQSSERATSLITVLEELTLTTDFDAIDDHRHEFEASQLRLEKEKLEASNDRVKELKSKLAATQAEITGLDSDRDSFLTSVHELRNSLMMPRDFWTVWWRHSLRHKMTGLSQLLNASSIPSHCSWVSERFRSRT